MKMQNLLCVFVGISNVNNPFYAYVMLVSVDDKIFFI